MSINHLHVSPEFDKYTSKLQKAVDFFKNEIASIRANRANTNVLNKIVIDYYGTPTPISQMANISVPEARMIVISPWDAGMLKEISKAIMASDIGINPSDDGKIIRLVFPQLTSERRAELTKQVKKISEETKVVLRNERRDIIEVLKKLKKDSLITEDEQVTFEKEIQKALDKEIENVDRLYKEKEAEIIEV